MVTTTGNAPPVGEEKQSTTYIIRRLGNVGESSRSRHLYRFESEDVNKEWLEGVEVMRKKIGRWVVAQWILFTVEIGWGKKESRQTKTTGEITGECTVQKCTRSSEADHGIIREGVGVPLGGSTYYYYFASGLKLETSPPRPSSPRENSQPLIGLKAFFLSGRCELAETSCGVIFLFCQLPHWRTLHMHFAITGQDCQYVSGLFKLNRNLDRYTLNLDNLWLLLVHDRNKKSFKYPGLSWRYPRSQLLVRKDP